MKLRNMTSVFLRHDCKLLMMLREGSKVLPGALWVGPGGHMEPHEMDDPAACALRELYEETGIRADQVKNLRLRYVSSRLMPYELRHNYYFFGDLPHPPDPLPISSEGRLAWIPEAEVPALAMPFSASSMLNHYLATGKHDEALYLIECTAQNGEPRAVVTRMEPYT